MKISFVRSVELVALFELLRLRDARVLHRNAPISQRYGIEGKKNPTFGRTVSKIPSIIRWPVTPM